MNAIAEARLNPCRRSPALAVKRLPEPPRRASTCGQGHGRDLLTYALSLFLNVPQVLWTVLTAVVMSQLSLGKSVKTAADYFLGTVGGAAYSGLVSAVLPHRTELEFLVVLAVTIAPLAFLGAIWPRLSVAPFTAVMVLLAPAITHATPLELAMFRVIEVGLGGLTALFVSFVVLPSRAQNLGVEAAANMLRLMAAALRQLLAGCADPLDVAALHKISERPRAGPDPSRNNRRRGAARARALLPCGDRPEAASAHAAAPAA